VLIARARLARLVGSREDITLAEAMEYIFGNLTPVTDLGRIDPEDWFVSGVLKWAGILGQAAVAAQLSHVQVFNNTPNDRAGIVVVESFWLDAQVAASINVGPSSAYSTVGTTGFRDTQWSPTDLTAAAPDVEMRRLTNAAQTGTQTRLQLFAPTFPDGRQYDIPWVLGPQTGLGFVHQTVNQFLDVNAIGYKVELRNR
jgi:hypothetical protein